MKWNNYAPSIAKLLANHCDEETWVTGHFGLSTGKYSILSGHVGLYMKKVCHPKCEHRIMPYIISHLENNECMLVRLYIIPLWDTNWKPSIYSIYYIALLTFVVREDYWRIEVIEFLEKLYIIVNKNNIPKLDAILWRLKLVVPSHKTIQSTL